VIIFKGASAVSLGAVNFQAGEAMTTKISEHC